MSLAADKLLRILAASYEALRDIESHVSLLSRPRMTAEGDQTRAAYGVPTEENTLTWGDSIGDLSFNNASGGAETFIIQAPQMLVHAARLRPTAWQVAFVVKFGQGWTGEASTTIALALTIGIGKGKETIVKLYTIATPASNSQPVLDLFQVPSQAIQGTCEIAVVSTQQGVHAVQASLFVAPVVQ